MRGVPCGVTVTVAVPYAAKCLALIVPVSGVGGETRVGGATRVAAVAFAFVIWPSVVDQVVAVITTALSSASRPSAVKVWRWATGTNGFGGRTTMRVRFPGVTVIVAKS